MERIKAYISAKMILVLILFFVIITSAITFAYKKSNSTAGTQTDREITASAREIEPGNREIVKSNTVTPKNKEAYTIDDTTTKVVLNVQNMSCSGCIATIKGSLDGIDGIKDVIVDITNGKTDVYYDIRKVTDVSRIEDAITASGYPAKVQRVYAAEEIKQEQALMAAKSRNYIASVGKWDIARTDFETELSVAKKQYAKKYGNTIFSDPRGDALIVNLKNQIAAQLINEGVFMQEIQRTGFTIDEQAVEKMLQESLKAKGKSYDDFRKMVSETGYEFDYFMRRYRIKILINKYLEEKVLADATNDFDRQNAFKAWYSNSKILAPVVFYDKELERLQQYQAGSGSCCPVN